MSRGNGLGHRLYSGEVSFDFIGRRRIGYALSGIVLVLTVVFLIARGLNLGIDFKGGVSWEVASPTLTQSQVEGILSKNGIAPGKTELPPDATALKAFKFPS